MIPLGQRLQQERIRKSLSIDEVAKATKIRAKFILALERGDYKRLPSSAYIQGFVKNYADFLGLPKKETLALFRREFDEREFIGVLPESFSAGKTKLSGLRFHVSTLLIALGILFICGFIFFEYRPAFFSPELQIFSPVEGAKVQTQTLTIVGRTDANTVVTVNDATVYIDKDGTFKKNVSIFLGENTITVKAINKFGRKTQIERHIFVR